MSTEVLAVIGTLGAAFLGFIGIIYTNYQNNRHADDLEKLKYKRDEQARENEKQIALLEEFSSLYFKLNKGRYSYLRESAPRGLPTFPLSETVNRMSVIAILYLDDFKKAFFEYVDAHGRLQKLYGQMADFVEGIDGSNVSEEDSEYAAEIRNELEYAKGDFDIVSGHLLVAIKEMGEKIKAM